MSRGIIKKNQIKFFFERIQKLMEKLGWDQAHFARATSLSTVTIFRWSKNDHPPSSAAIRKIVEGTGCNTAWLISGDGDMWSESGPKVQSLIESHTSQKLPLGQVVVIVEACIQEEKLSLTPEKKGRIIQLLNDSDNCFSEKDIKEVVRLASI